MIWQIVRQIAKVGVPSESPPDIGEEKALEPSRIQRELLFILGHAQKFDTFLEKCRVFRSGLPMNSTT